MSEERDVQAQQKKQSDVENDISDDTANEQSATLETEQSEETQNSENDEAAQQIYELQNALAEAQNKLKEQQEGVLRARADMENARRRAEAEVDKARKFALERFASELLPVIDNLERAIEVGDGNNDAVKPLLEGVEMTLKSFISTIEKFGMTPINPQGETFNPELHQAMAMQESTEHSPNTVMTVMQKGYDLNGRLLRPAMVMVARAPSSGVDTQA